MQYLKQLGRVGGDAPGLIAAEQLGRRSTSRPVRRLGEMHGCHRREPRAVYAPGVR